VAAAPRASPSTPVESGTSTPFAHLRFIETAFIALAFGAGATI
jgi:hypothetical protein